MTRRARLIAVAAIAAIGLYLAGTGENGSPAPRVPDRCEPPGRTNRKA